MLAIAAARSTSLPWRSWGGIRVHGWTFAVTFVLQIETSGRVADARACPRLLELMYPSRTRGPLSACRTANARALKLDTEPS